MNQLQPVTALTFKMSYQDLLEAYVALPWWRKLFAAKPVIPTLRAATLVEINAAKKRERKQGEELRLKKQVQAGCKEVIEEMIKMTMNGRESGSVNMPLQRREIEKALLENGFSIVVESPGQIPGRISFTLDDKTMTALEEYR